MSFYHLRFWTNRSTNTRDMPDRSWANITTGSSSLFRGWYAGLQRWQTACYSKPAQSRASESLSRTEKRNPYLTRCQSFRSADATYNTALGSWNSFGSFDELPCYAVSVLARVRASGATLLVLGPTDKTPYTPWLGYDLCGGNLRERFELKEVFAAKAIGT
jgi:hypothetical protein